MSLHAPNGRPPFARRRAKPSPAARPPLAKRCAGHRPAVRHNSIRRPPPRPRRDIAFLHTARSRRSPEASAGSERTRECRSMKKTCTQRPGARAAGAARPPPARAPAGAARRPCVTAAASRALRGLTTQDGCPVFIDDSGAVTKARRAARARARARRPRRSAAQEGRSPAAGAAAAAVAAAGLRARRPAGAPQRRRPPPPPPPHRRLRCRTTLRACWPSRAAPRSSPPASRGRR